MDEQPPATNTSLPVTPAPKKSSLLLLSFVLLGAFLGSAPTYYFLHKKNIDQAAMISQLNSQIASTKSQTSTVSPVQLSVTKAEIIKLSDKGDINGNYKNQSLMLVEYEFKNISQKPITVSADNITLKDDGTNSTLSPSVAMGSYKSFTTATVKEFGFGYKATINPGDKISGSIGYTPNSGSGSGGYQTQYKATYLDSATNTTATAAINATYSLNNQQLNPL